MADLDHLIAAGSPPAQSTTKAALGVARAKLNRPPPPEPVWKLLGAAVLCAASALVLATTIIMGPPAMTAQQTDVNPWVR